MPPAKMRTYSRDRHVSMSMFDVLFATNLTQKKLQRGKKLKKRKYQAKELPKRVETILKNESLAKHGNFDDIFGKSKIEIRIESSLTSSSIHVNVDDTFDRVKKKPPNNVAKILLVDEETNETNRVQTRQASSRSSNNSSLFDKYNKIFKQDHMPSMYKSNMSMTSPNLKPPSQAYLVRKTVHSRVDSKIFNESSLFFNKATEIHCSTPIRQLRPRSPVEQQPDEVDNCIKDSLEEIKTWNHKTPFEEDDISAINQQATDGIANIEKFITERSLKEDLSKKNPKEIEKALDNISKILFESKSKVKNVSFFESSLNAIRYVTDRKQKDNLLKSIIGALDNSFHDKKKSKFKENISDFNSKILTVELTKLCLDKLNTKSTNNCSMKMKSKIVMDRTRACRKFSSNSFGTLDGMLYMSDKTDNNILCVECKLDGSSNSLHDNILDISNVSLDQSLFLESVAKESGRKSVEMIQTKDVSAIISDDSTFSIPLNENDNNICVECKLNGSSNSLHDNILDISNVTSDQSLFLESIAKNSSRKSVEMNQTKDVSAITSNDSTFSNLLKRRTRQSSRSLDSSIPNSSHSRSVDSSIPNPSNSRSLDSIIPNSSDSQSMDSSIPNSLNNTKDKPYVSQILQISSDEEDDKNITKRDRSTSILIIDDTIATPNRPLVSRISLSKSMDNLMNAERYFAKDLSNRLLIMNSTPSIIASNGEGTNKSMEANLVIDTTPVVKQFKLPNIVNVSGKLWRKSLKLKRRNISIPDSPFDNTSTTQSSRLSAVIVPSDHARNLRRKTALQTYAETELEHLTESDSPKKVLTAKELVLNYCGQPDIVPFEEMFPKSVLDDCKKIGEGAFGEVFQYPKAKGQFTVVKIIPVDGNLMVNGEKQKNFDEILPEISIAWHLSNLRNSTSNKTSSFCQLERVCCVKGKYPQKLCEHWHDFDENQGSENDPPTIFEPNQQYIILELKNGGHDLESFVFTNAVQAISLFKQVACALAVAEEQLQFEHRDLHWGNILVKKVGRDKKIVFKRKGRTQQIPSNGVEATIIDFTLSRITQEGVTIFTNLGEDPELFNGYGNYQFDIYRLMKEKNQNNWKSYTPYSNILWLHYVLTRALASAESGFRYKNEGSKTHQKSLEVLEKYEKEILNSKSATEFVDKCLS